MKRNNLIIYIYIGMVNGVNLTREPLAFYFTEHLVTQLIG